MSRNGSGDKRHEQLGFDCRPGSSATRSRPARHAWRRLPRSGMRGDAACQVVDEGVADIQVVAGASIRRVADEME
ncbi:hypothetical protein [Nocardia nova]|uniref:hypothetical protein n=1 Tax=Nocardia nova TaxID=37330 RepID=UPI0011B09F3F|nr:hypothetical protein [Nocardia nova]